MMYRTQRANAPNRRSWQLQYLVYVAIGNLLAAILINPGAPARAYEGFFEMFGKAAQSVSEQVQPSAPAPQQDGTISPTGTPFNRGSQVTEAEFRRLGFLRFPQSRKAMNEAIGYPLAASYGALDGYEEHRLFDGRLLTVTYRSDADSSWVAVAVGVQ
jgi:hypothetical protein